MRVLKFPSSPLGIIKYIIFVIAVVPSYLVAHPATRGPPPEARLYEGLEISSRFIEYSLYPEGWTNMEELKFQVGFESLGLLCVTGTFLGYSQPNFQAADEHEIKLLSGVDSCIEIGPIMSVQMVSSYVGIYSLSISLFSEKLFTGRALPLTRSLGDFQIRFGNRVESIIMHGVLTWTIITTKGPYCLKPSYDLNYEFPICIIPDIRNTEIGNQNEWKLVARVCHAGVLATIDVTDCFEFGGGRKNDWDGDKKNNRLINGTVQHSLQPAIKGCNENDEILSLLDLRMHTDFNSHYQMRYPKDKSLAWRTELLDTAFDITLGVCPPDAVSPLFLTFIREMYIYLAESKIWSKSGGGWPKNNTVELKSINRQTEDCLNYIMEKRLTPLTEAVSQYFSQLTSLQNTTNDIRKEFARKPGLDLVMEIVWLISNQVMSLCHVISGHETNFWTEFYSIFEDMYLLPLTEHWATPERFLSYYPILLGGLDIEKQFQMLAYCVSISIDDEFPLEIHHRPYAVIGSNA